MSNKIDEKLAEESDQTAEAFFKRGEKYLTGLRNNANNLKTLSDGIPPKFKVSTLSIVCMATETDDPKPEKESGLPDSVHVGGLRAVCIENVDRPLDYLYLLLGFASHIMAESNRQNNPAMEALGKNIIEAVRRTYGEDARIKFSASEIEPPTKH